MKRIIPAICTSSRCNNHGCNYCTACSHAIFEFRPKVNGKVYKGHFEPTFGFLFNRGGLKNEPDWSPNARHPLWKAIDKWYGRFQKQAKKDAVELEKDHLKENHD